MFTSFVSALEQVEEVGAGLGDEKDMGSGYKRRKGHLHASDVPSTNTKSNADVAVWGFI